MNTLFIIGNGFDLAHELKTSYWDFRTYLSDNHPDFLIQFEDLYNIGVIDDADPRIAPEMVQKFYDSINLCLWKDFANRIGNPDISEMMNFSQSILGELNLEGANYGIKDTMDCYWQDQYGFVKKFSKYVLEWANSIDTTTACPQKKSLINSDDVFFTFNYTDVLEKIYGIKNALHIHGGVDSVSTIPPIMGHSNSKDIEQHAIWSNECEEQFNEGESSIHNAIVKYLKSIYKDTASIISGNNAFWDSLIKIDKVIVFGWSAGTADLPYLNKIKEKISPESEWIVYYFDNTAKKHLEEAMKTCRISESYKVNYYDSKEFWDK